MLTRRAQHDHAHARIVVERLEYKAKLIAYRARSLELLSRFSRAETASEQIGKER